MGMPLLPCSLAEELVALSQSSEQHAGAQQELNRVQQEHAQVRVCGDFLLSIIATSRLGLAMTA